MIKTYRVMLLPNNQQNTKLFQYADVARFAYNWALEKQMTQFQNGGSFLSDVVLRKEFTQFKKTEEGQNTINIFKKWANHFVENYIEGDKAKQWYKSPLSYDLYQHLNKALNQQTVMILYYSYGDGFKEEQKFCSEVKIVSRPD